MLLNEKQVLGIKRKRGELDYSNKELADQTGVSVWTLSKILNHKQRKVTSITFFKLNNWLLDQYIKN